MEPKLLWGLGLIGAALLLLLLEIFIPSMGVLFVTAIVVALAGVVTLFTYDPKKRATYLKNRLSNLAAYNPQFTSVGTTVLFANNPVAKPYGAYGTGLWAK